MLMKSLDNITLEAIERCIEQCVPFACYIKPHDHKVNFIADDSPRLMKEESMMTEEIDNFRGFLITTYGLGQNKRFYGITSKYTAEQVTTGYVQGNAGHTSPYPNYDTPKSKYLQDVSDIINSLNGDGEKAVYARQRIVKSNNSISSVADLYFASHPESFRFLYYTPATGLWLGASPELLVELDFSDNRLSTMALAGTRSITVPDDWSEKNLLEHNIVVEFIAAKLRSLGTNPTIFPTRNLTFGAVEHLATPIEAHPAVSLSQLICLLSPTPALCGWPTEKANALLTAHEQFDRKCYGGTIGECTAAKSLIYVNLRSAEIAPGSPSRYRMIAGGGITENSDPEEEWEETENKMKSLYDIINHTHTL